MYFQLLNIVSSGQRRGVQNKTGQGRTKRDTVKGRIDSETPVSPVKPMKNATPSNGLRGGAMCSQKEYNTHEKQGENVDLSLSGAPGGATWGEIRGLIARCDDLPEDVRGRLVALGDKSVTGAVECSNE